MKRCSHVVVLSSLLAGCSVFTQPPRPDAAALQEQSKALGERSAWVESRRDELEKKGLSKTDAQTMADLEYSRRTR